MNRRNFCKLLGASTTAFSLPSFAIAQHELDKLSSSRDMHKEVQYLMGTLLSITVFHSKKETVRAFFNEAFETATRLDQLLSNYKDSSEISLLNSKRSLKLSSETYEVLKLGKQYETKTNGIFNIGIGSLGSIWKKSIPQDDSLATLRDSSSTQYIELDSDNRASFSNKVVQVDTGGIGKGYAVDRIVSLFDKYSIDSALINFGESTLYAHGTPSKQKSWNLALKFPNEKAKGILKLKDTAASASAALGETYLINSQIYGHIIDPRNGKPLVEKRCAAVVCSSALEAEVLSSDAVVRNSMLESKNITIAGYIETKNKERFFGDLNYTPLS